MKQEAQYHQWSLRGAFVLFAVSLGWLIWGEGKVKALQSPVSAIFGSDLEENAAWLIEPGSTAGSAGWTDPAIGAGELDWVFDVFTPPVIFYNRETERFSVTRPEADLFAAEDAAGAPFGIQLLRVEPELYRLQIVGYAGYDGDEWGIFQNEETGEGFVAQAGARLDDLGLEVRAMSVRREDLIVPDSMPLREIVGVAEIWDPNTQEVVRLSSSGRRVTDSPIAFVRDAETGEEFQVQAGDRFTAGVVAYEILAVRLNPTEIRAQKVTESGIVETQTLVPESEISEHFDTDSGLRTP
jgi:hypothetical protein